jgi:hypothetical protein
MEIDTQNMQKNSSTLKKCLIFLIQHMGHNLFECLKKNKGIVIFQYFKIPQHFKTFQPTFPPIHTNCIISMCQALKTFKSHDL